MAKNTRYGGPSSAQTDIGDSQVHFPKTDLQLGGSGSNLIVGGTATVGGVVVSGTPGTVNVLSVGGAIQTFHDFLLVPAAHMATTGTAPVPGAGVPRAVLAKGNAVAWAREVPAGWSQVSVNLLFTKQVATSGNVHWSMNVDVVNFLTGASLNGAGTTFDLGGVSVPTNVGDSKYYIPPTTQAILTPMQAFGIPPLISVTLTRVNDGIDTYVNSAGLVSMTLSRTA